MFIGLVSSSCEEKRLAEKAAKSRTSDSLSVQLATVSSPPPAGAIAVELDGKAHQYGISHGAVHEAAASTHLDSAAVMLRRGADTKTIQAELNSGAAGTAPMLKRRHGALAAQLQPRLRAEAAKQAAAARTTGIALRRAYARTYEEHLLDKGINATVTASGPDLTRLTMKWILVSKVVAHQYAKGDIIGEMRVAGFKRFTITDGYDESWTWRLDR